MSIQNYLNQIKNAVFGKDVRQSIYDAIKQCYDDASVDHDNANMEVKLARGTHSTLNDRLTENEKNQKNFSEQLDKIEKDIRPVSQYLLNSIKNMMVGEKVVIDCYGDSTYWGHASGVDPIGSQVSEPPTVILQKILRSYFNNNNIIVNNYGAKGNSTQEIINSINPNTEASVIFFNYCINDAKDWWTDVETYKNNIIKFVESFRARGKEVILDMPNIVTGYDFAGHGMGTQLRALQVSIMADVMLDVSKKINIPLIDNYNLTQQYTYSNCYMPKTIPDGMHPSDEMYIAKALNMASVFISQRSSYVDSKSVISCIDSSIVSYGTSVVQKVGNSLCGCALMANSIKIGLNFTENCKLYLAFPVWSSGSDNVQIAIDGKVQKSINLKNENLNPTISYLTDMLVLINENMTKGFHVIEINNASTGNVGLNYLMTTPISEINPIKVPYEVSKNYNTALAKYNINSIEFKNTEKKETIVTYNIPTEILNNDLIIEFNATLKNGEGIGLLTTQRTNVSTVNTEYKALASLLIYIAENKLKIATGDNVDYDTSHQPLSENNYGGASHNYKIILAKSKELSLFIDGAKIVDRKQIDIKCVGGYLSLWKADIGTMKINNLSVF